MLLSQHPAVPRSRRGRAQEEKANAYLAAYVVPEEVHTFSVPALRSSLQEKLPEYMIPAHFV